MTTDISVGVRWDPLNPQANEEEMEFDYDGGNSSSRLFERSRIKALAGKNDNMIITIEKKGQCYLNSRKLCLSKSLIANELSA